MLTVVLDVGLECLHFEPSRNDLNYPHAQQCKGHKAGFVTHVTKAPILTFTGGVGAFWRPRVGSLRRVFVGFSTCVDCNCMGTWNTLPNSEHSKMGKHDTRSGEGKTPPFRATRLEQRGCVNLWVLPGSNR